MDSDVYYRAVESANFSSILKPGEDQIVPPRARFRTLLPQLWTLGEAGRWCLL